MQPGYSGTPLIKKLGIKETDKVRLINIPNEYFSWLEKDVSTQVCNKTEQPDFVHAFVSSNKNFENTIQELLLQIKPGSIIWISWYKKSSGKQTDVTEDVIRNYALKNNLVDVKVCAVSDEWSGLKLVVPLAKRNLFHLHQRKG